jgi:dienelactone hydrolase
MYQTKKNVSKQVVSIIFSVLFVFVSSMFLTAGANGNGDVEQIYNSIRQLSWDNEGQESIHEIWNEGKKMVATLTLPNSGEKGPIVLIFAGFLGPRDGIGIPGTSEKYWERTSYILSRQGIASLRLDFRGYGDSDGEFYEASFSTQLSDIDAAIDYIQSDLKHVVNHNSIGVMGVSQGGMLSALTAARDKRVDSAALWSPVANPPDTYGALMLREGMQKGINLPVGGHDSFPLYILGNYVGLDVQLGHAFFQDVYGIDPVAEIRNYKNPMMVITGKNDIIVWPQPAKGNLFMKYHDGMEMLVELDADHEFNFWDGPVAPKFTDAIYWTTAWFIKTLK